MKTFERILIKVVIIQLIFLLTTQFFLHELKIFPELLQLSQYEGVTDDNFSELLNVFRGQSGGR